MLDPENARITEFLREEASRLSISARVLDAGAGSKPYKELFSASSYESCDMPGGFYSDTHDFECYLDNIPRNESNYDAVVLTQVLEHVPDPKAVLTEIHRVLKPGGKLFLSVPLTAPLHGEPWHFFHFTHYGIETLAYGTNYEVSVIEKIGGAFWVLGKRMPDAFRKLFKQYDPFRARKRGLNVLYCLLMNVVLLPLYFIAYLPSAYLFRPLCYWMDRLDIEKSFTLGYTAVLIKRPDK